MPRGKTFFTLFGGIIALAVAAAGVVAVVLRISSLPPPRFSVLLITLDTTRADRLGCYGYRQGRTPRIDAFAKEATLFDLAIAQASSTPVSHASIFTGLNPYRHGLRVMHGLTASRLQETHPTLAKVWRDAGGDTAAFVSAYPVTSAFGLDQGFSDFDARFPARDAAPAVKSGGVVRTAGSQRRADDTTSAAARWIGQRGERKKPFLLWVHYFDPHDPEIVPPRDILDQFAPSGPTVEDRLRALYDAEVFFMDGEIGRLFDTLRGAGLWEKTIVVLVADHGEGLGDHGWWTHGILYQEQIRVPLLIRVPGMEARARVSSLVRTIDIMPTILRRAGVRRRVWPDMDGRDLTPEMQGDPSAPPRIAYSDGLNLLLYVQPRTQRRDVKDDKLYSVIDGSWKLIYHQLHPERTELFDLASDPGETRNLAELRARERYRLESLLSSMNALSDIMPAASEPDQERDRKLDSLGYVH